jgi:O-antigen/teichoic acid export membrane protein
MLKKILYSFSIYTLTSVICSLLTIITLPFLTENLTEKDYGISALFSSYILILSPIIGFSSSGLFWINFFKKERDLIENENLFSTYFWLVVFCTILILVLLFFGYHLIQEFSTFSLCFLLLIPLSSFFSLIGEETKTYFINNKRPKEYLFYNVSISIIELGLIFFFVKYIYKSWQGRIIAWVIVLIIQFFFTLWIFAKKESYLKLKFSIQNSKKLIRYGLPLIFHQLGKFVVNQSDRLFIVKMLSIESAGIYSIGYQFGSMILLPISAFINFYTPFLYERLANLDLKKMKEIINVSYLYILILLIGYIAMIFIAPYFFDIFIATKFHDGIKFVPWVALSYVFWGIYMLFAAVIFFKEKTKFLGWFSFINIALNLVLNYIFIKNYGSIGAAYATALSFFIVLIITAIYSSTLQKLPWFYFLRKEVNFKES